MDSLDAQIKSLQRKKVKIAMLRSIQSVINEMPDSPEHEGLKDEIRAFFDGIVNSAVVAIQSGNGGMSQQVTPPVLEDRGSLPQGSDAGAENQPPRKLKPVQGLADFVRQHSHLGFKKISGKDLNGDLVKGIVKKIDYPNLLVETDDGNLVEVDPQTAKEEE